MILDYPRKGLRWLSLSTLTTWVNSYQAFSSSQTAEKSKKFSKPTTTPSAPTATDTDTYLPDPPRNTARAPFVHFTILFRHIDAKTPPAPKEGTRNQSPGAARPPPPHCPNSGCDHDAFSRECSDRPVPPPQPEASPLPSPRPQAPCRVKTPWMWRTMATRHPLRPRPLQPPVTQ